MNSCPMPHFFFHTNKPKKKKSVWATAVLVNVSFLCTGNLKRVADSFRSVTGAVIIAILLL